MGGSFYKVMVVTFITILVLMDCFIFLAIGYVAHDDIQTKIRNFRVQDRETPEECNNLSLQDTAYCLNSYVNKIYKYKIRNDMENPTFEELVEEGGDCYNWAELYVDYAEQLGYHGTIAIMPTKSNTGHAIAIISEEEGYCLLDQRVVLGCFMF